MDARTHVFLSSGKQEVPASKPLIILISNFTWAESTQARTKQDKHCDSRTLQRRHFFITPDAGLEPDAGAGTGRRGWNRTPGLEPDAGGGTGRRAGTGRRGWNRTPVVEPDAGLEPDAGVEPDQLDWKYCVSLVLPSTFQ